MNNAVCKDMNTNFAINIEDSVKEILEMVYNP